MSGRPQAGAPGSAAPRKPTKVFGLMSKRRWFCVTVFLCMVLWSYTAGPPLEEAIVCNQHFKNHIPYDYKTVRQEGDLDMLYKIFEPSYWPDVFIWQAGAFFKTITGASWNDAQKKLVFTDGETGKYFSYSKHHGVQIVSDEDTDAAPGGLVFDPNQADILYSTEQAHKQIIKWDLATNKKSVLVSEYNGAPLNGPWDLTVDSKGEYLYFTDPTFNTPNPTQPDTGLYRFSLTASQPQVELLTTDLAQPAAVVLSTDESRLFVSDCIEGEVSIHSFATATMDHLSHWTNADLKWNGKVSLSKVTKLKNGTPTKLEGSGCVRGMEVHPDGYLIATCPGEKLCILSADNGEMKSAIKLPNGADLNDVEIAMDGSLYITSNYSLWQIQLQKSPLNLPQY